MPPPLRLNAVAFISPQNYPILVRTFQKGQELKYHYVAHTSLDVIEERSRSLFLQTLHPSQPTTLFCD